MNTGFFTGVEKALKEDSDLNLIIRKKGDILTLLVRIKSSSNTEYPPFRLRGTSEELEDQMVQNLLTPVAKAVDNYEEVKYFENIMQAVEDNKREQATAKANGKKKPKPTEKIEKDQAKSNDDGPTLFTS